MAKLIIVPRRIRGHFSHECVGVLLPSIKSGLRVATAPLESQQSARMQS